MWTPGLLSITFRQLSADDIVAFAAEQGLGCMEWGGDVHVPHGDTAEARRVAKLTTDAGLTVAAYGSYYRCGVEPGDKQPTLEATLDSCEALGAGDLRVWPGNVGSFGATGADRQRIADDLRRVAEGAGKRGIRVLLEFHGGTLTDTSDSAIQLLNETANNNVKLYWQPPNELSPAGRLSSLRTVLDQVVHAHVFYWTRSNDPERERRPLTEGEADWTAYFDVLASQPVDRCVMLEFVRDDSLEQAAADAQTLKAWVERVNG